MLKKILKSIITAILTVEARLVLWKYKPKIIAITGNVGKTSTKDAIYAVLSKAYFIRKSDKSFNSDIGIPLTILGVKNGWNNPMIWIHNIVEGLALILLKNHYPKRLVLEIGADRPGDIKKICKWLSPDISVVTRIGDIPVHIEFFKSSAEVVKEKSYIVSALKNDGLLVLSDDEKNVLPMREKTKARTVTYGFSEGVQMRATNKEIIYNSKKHPIGINFKVNYGSSVLPVKVLGTTGFQHIYSILAALSVGVSEDVNLVSATEWIGEYETPPGRLKILEGINNTVILDDTYNSSPTALHGALESLKNVNTTGRKIAVLGDMMELGKYSNEEHNKAGKHASEVCDLLFTVGPRAKGIVDGALQNRMKKDKIKTFKDSIEAGEELMKIISEGDIILLKGSQSVRMERAVEKIMAHPEDKNKLLVRQDKEWLKR